MSDYLALVTFEDGTRLLAVYNNTSDNLRVRSLVPDSEDARRAIDKADRYKYERFDALHRVQYGEMADRRGPRLLEQAHASTERVVVQIPGYEAAFLSHASRQHNIVTGRVDLPSYRDDADYVDFHAPLVFAFAPAAPSPTSAVVQRPWYQRLFVR
jgi:hypothetical protein